MLTVLLAKTVANLSFGGAFMFYLVKYIISGLIAFGAIVLGIKLSKRKKAKKDALTTEE